MILNSDIDLSLTGFDEDEVNRILKNDITLSASPPDPIVVQSHTRTPSVPSSKTSKPVTVKGDSFALGSLKLTCMDSEAAADCDWIIKRWQVRTGENAIHKKGLTFNDLKDAREK